MPRKDLTGQRFGRLVVLEEAGRNYRNVTWRCKCECGNIVIVQGNFLRNERIKSCGCLEKRDLTGQKFGRLIILEKAGREKHGGILWKCQCQCKKENIVIIQANNLRNGNTKSCGCYRKEKNKKGDNEIYLDS